MVVVNQSMSELGQQVATLSGNLLIFSGISRIFLTLCFGVVITVSPTMFMAVLRVKEVALYLR